MGNSLKLYDQLLYLALITGYPTEKKPKQSYDLKITEDEYELSDYLLSITIDRSELPAYSRAVILTWLWLLDGSKTALSTYYKEYSINTTVLGFLPSEYYKLF